MTRFLERTAHYFVTGSSEERLLAQWITSIMVAIHWGLGISILVGGPQRFVRPTYQPLIDLVLGQTWIWGVAITLAGAFMLAPFRMPNIIGLSIAVVWMIFWTASFSVSVVTYPNAAATAAVAYAGFALINTALLTVRVIEKPLLEV